MTISTDSAIEFFGTQDTVITTAGTIADGGFSSAGEATTWTNDDDARYASAVLTATFATAPDANSSVTLVAKLNDIDGANDAHEPDANNLHTYLGSFPLNDSTAAQYIAIEITLPNAYTSQSYDFYIQNNAGQTLSAGATVKVTPKSIGPHD